MRHPRLSTADTDTDINAMDCRLPLLLCLCALSTCSSRLHSLLPVSRSLCATSSTLPAPMPRSVQRCVACRSTEARPALRRLQVRDMRAGLRAVLVVVHRAQKDAIGHSSDSERSVQAERGGRRWPPSGSSASPNHPSICWPARHASTSCCGRVSQPAYRSHMPLLPPLFGGALQQCALVSVSPRSRYSYASSFTRQMRVTLTSSWMARV